MPDPIALSESAVALLRRRLDGDGGVTESDRADYRELVAAGIMYPVHSFTRGDEASYRFTDEGWDRRFELIAPIPVPSLSATPSPRG